jgi:hypothetical protein
MQLAVLIVSPAVQAICASRSNDVSRSSRTSYRPELVEYCANNAKLMRNSCDHDRDLKREVANSSCISWNDSGWIKIANMTATIIYRSLSSLGCKGESVRGNDFALRIFSIQEANEDVSSSPSSIPELV